MKFLATPLLAVATNRLGRRYKQRNTACSIVVDLVCIRAVHTQINYQPTIWSLTLRHAHSARQYRFYCRPTADPLTHSTRVAYKTSFVLL